MLKTALVSLQARLSEDSIETKGSDILNDWKVFRMDRPFNHVSAPSVAVNPNEKYDRYTVCVTVTK